MTVISRINSVFLLFQPDLMKQTNEYHTMKVKKRHLLSFLMIFLCWNSAKSQDIIINQDTISGTWGPDKIYLVKKDIRIPAGKSLTIQKGVTVRFYSGVRITVYGKLVAKGTSTDSVKFIPETSGTHWNNITIKNAGSPILKYCLFEGTEKLAAATSILRVTNDADWVPDVMAGAALGIAVSHIVNELFSFKYFRVMNDNIRVSLLNEELFYSFRLHFS
jgi:hypothetical protein